MKMEVERWDPEISGEFTEEKLCQKLEAEGYSVTRYVYPPGTHFPDHSHSLDKKDAVVSGRFKLELEGRIVTLGSGDAITIPAGVVHRAEVVGNEPVVSLDATRK
jgi:quercetin dioxygenase-like cupin family protein